MKDLNELLAHADAAGEDGKMIDLIELYKRSFDVTHVNQSDIDDIRREMEIITNPSTRRRAIKMMNDYHWTGTLRFNGILCAVVCDKSNRIAGKLIDKVMRIKGGEND